MRKTAIIILALVVLGAGTAFATERFAEAKAKGGLKALGFKVYWSLLDGLQKEEAKAIIADHLAETGPDRLAAASRLLRYRADVAAVLTKEQRAKAGKIRWTYQRLPKEKQIQIVDRLLDKTDRAAIADQVESLVDANPEAKVAGGLEILDRLHALLLDEARRRLALTEHQATAIDGLYREFRADIEPLALRIEKAKSDAVRKGLSILDDDQKTKLEYVKEEITTKVLAFLRG